MARGIQAGVPHDDLLLLHRTLADLLLYRIQRHFPEALPSPDDSSLFHCIGDHRLPGLVAFLKNRQKSEPFAAGDDKVHLRLPQRTGHQHRRMGFRL